MQQKGLDGEDVVFLVIFLYLFLFFCGILLLV